MNIKNEEGETVLKVLIADDESKVCRLIQMLCDWEKLDMELVGTAYNGLCAVEMIEQYMPDILITDICMPGCDGIEVIKRAREYNPALEVLIISGYADFKYAQSAIRYGVSDYLLKPIRQQELQETLEKLGSRCRQEKARLDASQQLLQFVEDDTQRKRCGLFFDLLLSRAKRPVPELEVLNEQYAYHFVTGVFRILILKLDYNEKKYDQQAVRCILDGVEEKIKDALEPCCEEMEICRDGAVSYIICNYKKDNTHQFRQAVRSAVDRITMKRFELWNAVFALGMGRSVNRCSDLEQSFWTAVLAVRERLIEGCDKLLEAPEHTGTNDYSDLSSTFNYRCAKAMELHDEQMVSASVRELKERLLSDKLVTGNDLLNMVHTVGVHALTRDQQEHHTDKVSEFLKACNDCSSADSLFALLEERLCQMVQESRLQREEESRKPIRAAKQYIMNHYVEPITLELVAEKVGFSSSYFSSLFKKETGVGFTDYLIQLRMEKAKDLLKNTKDSVKDICTAVGYSDLKHFTSMFRKYTGLKPGEFRKLYG